jgi:CRP-like cAMP-binding protein
MFQLMRKSVERDAVFTDEAFAFLTSLCEFKKLKKKEFLFREGEVDRHLAFVNKGCLRYYLVDTKGDEHIVYFAFEDWWIGDMNSFFNSKPTIYYMQALEDCELLLFTRENFTKALDEIPAFNDFFTKRTSQSYMAIQKRFAQVNTESAEERYVRLLQSQPEIFQRVPQHYIASFLGIKPQSLSRIRKNLGAKF